MYTLQNKRSLLTDALLDIGENNIDNEFLDQILKLNIINWQHVETPTDILFELEREIGEEIYYKGLRSAVHLSLELSDRYGELTHAARRAAEVHQTLSHLIEYVRKTGIDALNIEELEVHKNLYGDIACHLTNLANGAA